MELRHRIVALYGRFSPGMRNYFVGAIRERAGSVARDLTRRTDIVIVGTRADSLIETGALPSRLADARRRGKPILSEAAFLRRLNAAADDPPNFPLETALKQSGAASEDALLLAAFDLIELRRNMCRFGDVAHLKTVAGLRVEGCSSAQIVTFMREASRNAPEGRHRIAVGSKGEPMLQWENGLTTLAGQCVLALDDHGADLDDLFETATLAESQGALEKAARLYDMCARADKADAISLHNLGNVHLKQERWAEAVLAYRRSLSRDAYLLEARYNLAQALEGLGRYDDAIEELRDALHRDRTFSDALFNLGGLYIKMGRLHQARRAFEDYLANDPSVEWNAKAKKAISYCSSCLMAS